MSKDLSERYNRIQTHHENRSNGQRPFDLTGSMGRKAPVCERQSLLGDVKFNRDNLFIYTSPSIVLGVKTIADFIWEATQERRERNNNAVK